MNQRQNIIQKLASEIGIDEKSAVGLLINVNWCYERALEQYRREHGIEVSHDVEEAKVVDENTNL